MGFDHTKLVVGKKYPMRDGAKAEFVRINKHRIENRRLLWVVETDGDEMSFETCLDGMYMDKHNERTWDVISDEPIREPVEVKINTRFLVVYSDGTTGLSFCTATEAVKCSSRLQRATGIYELPNTLTVTPVNP
jgi:acyl-coenzyme A synthetase/AMP-(fatty) acid ligase